MTDGIRQDQQNRQLDSIKRTEGIIQYIPGNQEDKHNAVKQDQEDRHIGQDWLKVRDFTGISKNKITERIRQNQQDRQ
jgi:hypothetical protein